MSAAAVDYICSIMMPDDTLSLKVLLSRLDRAPAEAGRYFQRYCQNKRDLEVFLRENSDYFFVENKRVALHEEELETARDRAVIYFKTKMKEQCQGPVHYMDFKNQHFDYASDDIVSFICRFYPGTEFKKFFSSRPNDFVAHHDDTVFLTEVDSVRFYEKYLKSFGSMHFIRFRGHIGHAPDHVQKYINANYLGHEFRDFLENNSTMFRIDDKGMVHFAWQ